MTAIVSVQNSFNSFQKHDIPHPAVSYLVGGICEIKAQVSLKASEWPAVFSWWCFHLLGSWESSFLPSLQPGSVWSGWFFILFLLLRRAEAQFWCRRFLILLLEVQAQCATISLPSAGEMSPGMCHSRVWIVSQIVHIRGNFRVGKL